MSLFKRKNILRYAQKPAMLLVLCILMTLFTSGIFFTKGNISSILLSVCIYGVMVCGTIFPLLQGGIDLSIGSTAALAGSVTVLITLSFGYSTAGTVLGIVCGLLTGVVCGLFNGVVSYYFAIPAFVVTLAAKNVVLGIAQYITNKNTIICLHSDLMNWLGTGKILGIPFPVVFCIVLFVITWFILNKTVFGRYVYAVGGNPRAAKYSGIKSRFIGICAYVISGLTAAMAGIMLSCFNRQAVATQASGYDGDVLVALVVGGVSMAGGEGNILGAVFGLLLIGIINNAMVLLGVDAVYQNLIEGVLVIIAVAVDMRARNKDNGMKRKSGLRAKFKPWTFDRL